MIPYILKSSLCLLLLFGFYKLLLENEKLHRFNRFYLLFSLVFSLTIPFLTINVHTEHIAVFESHPGYQSGRSLTDLVDPKNSPIQPEFDFLIIASLVYWLVTLALLFRFCQNISVLLRLIGQRPKFRYQAATLVLLPDNCLPHTFLGYLFVSQSAYESQAIEPELFTHELAHIRQKHSFDILFVELLSSFYWFNPLFFLIRRAIRLNHEFLADAAVIDQHQHVVQYQRLLLSKLILSTSANLTSQLTSHPTKQRFLMMTKHTSRARLVITNTLVLSLFALLVVALC